jgi:hypothetical protein
VKKRKLKKRKPVHPPRKAPHSKFKKEEKL